MFGDDFADIRNLVDQFYKVRSKGPISGHFAVKGFDRRTRWEEKMADSFSRAMEARITVARKAVAAVTAIVDAEAEIANQAIRRRAIRGGVGIPPQIEQSTPALLSSAPPPAITTYMSADAIQKAGALIAEGHPDSDSDPQEVRVYWRTVIEDLAKRGYSEEVCQQIAEVAHHKLAERSGE